MSIDAYSFTLIHGQARKSRLLDFFAVACAEYLGYVLLGYLFIAALANNNWGLFFIPLLVAGVSRFVVTQAVYIFYQRKRPVETLSITALIKKPNHPSFPSGHTAFFFGLSFGLFFFSTPLTMAFIIASCFIALARIFCGVHWPSDILGGIASALVAWLVVLLLKGYQ